MRNILRVIKEYFSSSTLHGLHFIADDDQHWSERVFWTICCLLSWLGSALLIQSSWDNFQNNAISFVVETTYLDIDTSFPSISICEEDTQMIRVYDFAVKMFGVDHDCNLDEVIKEIAYFRGTSYYMKEFCFSGDIDCPKENYSSIANRVRSKCNDIFQLCKWRDEEFNCCEYFMAINTEYGVCYTLSPKNERRRKGQKILNMISNSKLGLASLYMETKVTTKIYLHSEDDIPYYNTLTTDILDALPNIMKRFTVSVTAIENEEEVHSLSVSQRKCRFPYENYLGSAAEYSYSACIMDCRMKNQLKLCNCTSHLMPNTKPEEHCNIKGLICLNDHYADLASPKTRWSTKSGLTCSCFPGCNEPEFNIITSTGVGIEANISKIEIAMDRLPSERYKRNVVRGRLDLVVSMGGAAGLFVGASILSFFELGFFFSLRLCHTKPKTQPQPEPKPQKILKPNNLNISKPQPSLKVQQITVSSRYKRTPYIVQPKRF
ncbi:sodium channel protein Nach isoform X2 [Nilaparvata lugens]|nr:sodium channel protein Nach isoform X2 [Nilaparvata lugens]XP_039296687.1 sodium channel protein Nach isoform X2 [Nilaparvata lugens]